MPSLPLTGAQHPLTLTGAARGHQHQRHRDVGGRIRHRARSVRDRDPMIRTGRHIDMIVANTKIGDHLAARTPEIMQDFVVDRVAKGHHHPVIDRKGGADFARCHRFVGVPHLHLELGLGGGQGLRRHGAADKYPFQCNLSPSATS